MARDAQDELARFLYEKNCRDHGQAVAVPDWKKLTEHMQHPYRDNATAIIQFMRTHRI